AAAVLVAAAAAAVFALSGVGGPSDVVVEPDLGGPNRQMSNEYALRHPDSPEAVHSSQWFVTSGSLFVRDDAGTNGPLDDRAADPHSVDATNSAVFRAYTKRRFEPSFRVEFEVRVEPPRDVPGLRPAPWDGLHLMVDAASPEAAYYVSVYRRNGQSVIKKKTPGGEIAGGSYFALSRYVPCRIAPGHWSKVRVDIRRAGPSAITIDLYENGILLTTATDKRSLSGSPPFTEGHIGLRADKTSFAIRDMTVEAI
ncbi:MAG: hypothetical protein ACTHLH_07330, partial [Solirubrobacterales bacterium]